MSKIDKLIEKELSEGMDSGTRRHMDALVDRRALQQFQDTAAIVADSLYEEGFESEDIFVYLSGVLSASF